MKIGDKFKFNIELMKENNISTDGQNGDDVHTVLDIFTDPVLGALIGFKLLNDCPGYFAQINECWLIPV